MAEPDEIRRLRNTHSYGHEPVNPIHGFPRASLGLPIIFHFKTPRDPDSNTLNIFDKDGLEARMASPVVLKPLAVSASEAVPLLLALNTQPIESHLNGSRLLLKQKQEFLPVSPPNRDAIASLLERAAQQWSGEVYRL
jgi:hypothetical protein